MKTTAVLALGLVASTQGFAPSSSQGRANTQLSESLFDSIFGLDLFAPKKDQNDYGARGKKDVKRGKITAASYIPSGMSAAQYQKIRDGEVSKKAANYDKNVKKAGIFEDYTEFYIKRGTDKSQAWKKDVNLGHRMAKTKYDWDNILSDKVLWAKEVGGKGKKGAKK